MKPLHITIIAVLAMAVVVWAAFITAQRCYDQGFRDGAHALKNYTLRNAEEHKARQSDKEAEEIAWRTKEV